MDMVYTESTLVHMLVVATVTLLSIRWGPGTGGRHHPCTGTSVTGVKVSCQQRAENFKEASALNWHVVILTVMSLRGNSRPPNVLAPRHCQHLSCSMTRSRNQAKFSEAKDLESGI